MDFLNQNITVKIVLFSQRSAKDFIVIINMSKQHLCNMPVKTVALNYLSLVVSLSSCSRLLTVGGD